MYFVCWVSLSVFYQNVTQINGIPSELDTSSVEDTRQPEFVWTKSATTSIVSREGYGSDIPSFVFALLFQLYPCLLYTSPSPRD